MRLALISDLHGNMASLDAVFSDIDRRGVDETVCLGDTATLGPRPGEVLATLRERACRCVLGNHDAFLLDAELIRTYTEVPIVVDSVDWCRERLSDEDRAFLARFETGIEVPLGRGRHARLFHGSPRSHMEDILATTGPEAVDECLAGVRAEVLAGGHTHLQMLRQHRGMLLVNPGSVGMPFEQYAFGQAPRIMPWAEYAIVEADEVGVHVELRRVDVDRGLLRREAAASTNPLCRALELQYA
jgi:predicted phosphodiesterase